MDLIFATNNQHKLNEIRQLIGKNINIFSLNDSGFKGEIPEDYVTLEENASQKAWYIFNQLRRNCFADDTGLEVEALGGDPGVFSARYSRIGDTKYAMLEIVDGNICKLLDNLKIFENRKARFRTVISLILEDKEFQFEGIVNGLILKEKLGYGGFGYDPIFLPDGYSKSFAQMTLREKNEISHRSLAISKLAGFLNDL